MMMMAGMSVQHNDCLLLLAEVISLCPLLQYCNLLSIRALLLVSPCIKLRAHETQIMMTSQFYTSLLLSHGETTSLG